MADTIIDTKIDPASPIPLEKKKNMQIQRKRTYGDSNREALREWAPLVLRRPCRCPAGGVPLQ